MATAPPFPISTAAAAGAANPALVWESERGLGYVGNLGYGEEERSIRWPWIDWVEEIIYICDYGSCCHS